MFLLTKKANFNEEERVVMSEADLMSTGDLWHLLQNPRTKMTNKARTSLLQRGPTLLQPVRLHIRPRLQLHQPRRLNHRLRTIQPTAAKLQSIQRVS